MAINGVALGALAVGGVFFYSAIKGKSVLATTQSIITGKSPATVKQTYPITSNTPGTNSSSQKGPAGTLVQDTGTNKSILQKTAATFGWTGAQWTALDTIENQEASYSTTVKNSSSGALGLAQALGHGTAGSAGTLGNEYGGYGLSDAQASLANSGDAAMQSLWMCNYIRDVYTNPINAEQFHLANNSY